ncbi:MAG: hypothetical protein GY841_11640, partial [FCB group bacterium]|nr:hypothetical protein [FCB group bacterium]
VVTSSSGDSVVARILPDPDRKGKYRSDLGILPPGTYDYKAELRAEAVLLGTFNGKFAVDNIDRETAFGDVDWTILSLTAQNSGGVFTSYKDLTPIVEAIDMEQTEFIEKREIRLWDNLVLLLIILASLSLEWFIRKRKQLL